MLDLVVVGHRDAAVDAGQEVRLDRPGPLLLPAAGPGGPDQDVVGGAEVRGHGPDGAQLRCPGRGGEHGERGRRHQHADQQRQRPDSPEPQLGPGESSHRGSASAGCPGCSRWTLAPAPICDYCDPYLVTMQEARSHRYLV
jgi:hypothetical protein